MFKQGLCALACASAVAAASPASATVMMTTWTGFVTSGNDATGVFGLATNASLIGQSFKAEFVFDLAQGRATTTATGDERRGGPAYAISGITEGSPAVGGMLTINGRSVAFSGAYAGVTATSTSAITQLMQSTRFTNEAGFGALTMSTTVPGPYPTRLTSLNEGTYAGSGNAQFQNGSYSLNLGATRIATEVRPGDISSPILPPSPGAPLDFEAFAGERIFIDPLVARGYDYAVLSGASILDALFPVIAGDTDGFQVYSADGSVFLGTAFAGTPFSFGPAGVRGFRLRDIDADLSPTDATAFKTGLRFASTGRVSMTQTPFVVEIGGGGVPEPASWALLLAGFGLAGGALRMRRTRHGQSAA